MLNGEKKYRLKFLFQQIDLNFGEFIIGRAPSCNLTLEDPLVSRNHVRIRLTEESARIDDLGSRNGTFVNNEPIFSDVQLHHNDRIRIGSHDLLFLIETPKFARPQKNTGALVTCKSCKIPFPLGAQACPHCGVQTVAEKKCPRCDTLCTDEDIFCTKCGAKIQDEETTIPVDLSGHLNGWTDGLINQVIDRAISQQRYEHAANLLEGKIEDYEIKEKKGVSDIALLMDISHYNAFLGEALDSSSRLFWVIDKWYGLKKPMPPQTFERIVNASSRHEELFDRLSEYLDYIQQDEQSLDPIQPLVDLLKKKPSGDTQ